MKQLRVYQIYQLPPDRPGKKVPFVVVRVFKRSWDAVKTYIECLMGMFRVVTVSDDNVAYSHDTSHDLCSNETHGRNDTRIVFCCKGV